MVLTNGRVEGKRAWHSRAISVKTGAPGRACPFDAGTGNALTTAAPDVPHSMGSLAPVPLGSKLTTLKCSRTVSGNMCNMTGRI